MSKTWTPENGELPFFAGAKGRECSMFHFNSVAKCRLCGPTLMQTPQAREAQDYFESPDFGANALQAGAELTRIPDQSRPSALVYGCFSE